MGRFNICDFLKKNMSISYSYGNMKISKLSDYGSVLCRLVWQSQLKEDLIGGVMISVLTSSAVDHGFERRSGQTKDYEICICCFSAKHHDDGYSPYMTMALNVHDDGFERTW